MHTFTIESLWLDDEITHIWSSWSSIHILINILVASSRKKIRFFLLCHICLRLLGLSGFQRDDF